MTHFNNDPCDEMVTTGQVAEYLVGANIWRGEIYKVLAFFFGITRDEAKRRCHAYAYEASERRIRGMNYVAPAKTVKEGIEQWL